MAVSIELKHTTWITQNFLFPLSLFIVCMILLTYMYYCVQVDNSVLCVLCFVIYLFICFFLYLIFGIGSFWMHFCLMLACPWWPRAAIGILLYFQLFSFIWMVLVLAFCLFYFILFILFYFLFLFHFISFSKQFKMKMKGNQNLLC